MATADPLPALLGPFLAAPGHSAVCVDFDGTLSAVVDVPDAARPFPGVVAVLRRLAARYALVCIVSGRPASFLLEHVGDGDRVRLTGLYGLEWVEGGRVVAHPGAARWRHAVEDVARRTEAEGPAGVLVERKGLSVTLHYRTEPGLEAATGAWAGAEADRTGLALHHARMSYELRPPLERDKGVAVAEAAAGMDAVCFVGDDRGDLPAFDALDRLAVAGVHVLRVGVRSAEAPSELLDRADLLVDGPEGVLGLLERLAADSSV